jgi:hypothetical protein
VTVERLDPLESLEHGAGFFHPVDRTGRGVTGPCRKRVYFSSSFSEAELMQ